MGIIHREEQLIGSFDWEGYQITLYRQWVSTPLKYHERYVPARGLFARGLYEKRERWTGGAKGDGVWVIMTRCIPERDNQSFAMSRVVPEECWKNQFGRRAVMMETLHAMRRTFEAALERELESDGR